MPCQIPEQQVHLSKQKPLKPEEKSQPLFFGYDFSLNGEATPAQAHQLNFCGLHPVGVSLQLERYFYNKDREALGSLLVY